MTIKRYNCNGRFHEAVEHNGVLYLSGQVGENGGSIAVQAKDCLEGLKKTLETGYTWYWSRSRQEYWNKGATSGHLQKVISIYGDCDDDTLLVNVEQTGVACHTGSYSCFFNEIYNSEE